MSGIPFSSFPLANIAEIQPDFQLYAESPDGEAFRVQLDEAVSAAIPSLPDSSISLAQMISTGLVTSQVAIVGTTAVVTQETLFSYTIPANFIATQGQGLEVAFFGFFAGNANTKTLRVKVGSTIYLVNDITTAPNARPFIGYFTMNRGATSLLLASAGDLKIESVAQSAQTDVSPFDWTIANTITITGQNSVATADDVRLFSVTVKVLR